MSDLLTEELYASDPEDLLHILQFARWLRWRRRINNYFFTTPQMHWVRPPQKPYRIGSRSGRQYYLVGR